MSLCTTPAIPGIEPVTTPAVAVEGVGKAIDDKPILTNVTFAIRSGGFAALLGANGAGKSTLLKILSALMPPTTGRIELMGTPLKLEDAGLRARLGMIGHASMLYRDLSAFENLMLFGRLYDVADPKRRALEMLELVQLPHRRDDPVKTLSRGMVQRVAIARALMHDPDLLLADEPFTGLDAPSRRMLETMLGQLNAQGRTILLVNHDVEQSLSIVEQVLVLRRGRLVANQAARDTSADEVLEHIVGPPDGGRHR